MSRNRFQLLLRLFHFVNNSAESDDRLYRIRQIMNHLNNVMKKNYVPDKSLCIDEPIMLWRGRLIFRQYIKNKKTQIWHKTIQIV